MAAGFWGSPPLFTALVQSDSPRLGVNESSADAVRVREGEISQAPFPSSAKNISNLQLRPGKVFIVFIPIE